MFKTTFFHSTKVYDRFVMLDNYKGSQATNLLKIL